ncbi:hypothetical protein SNE40_011405 [Patella caerulea]|uniref:Myotubularin phosphatase domain-containing protein n=1 Tax=Patella caerulea TaxID=87958 RepID=A0AAN8JNH1_PATCE
MKEKGKATFQSYVDKSEETLIDEDSNEEVEQNASKFFDKDLEPNLLPGEKIISYAKSVLKFDPFMNKKQGTSGHLFVTNFKVSFVTADKSSYEEVPSKSAIKRQRNKLIDENDIPLTNISNIYQCISGSKKKKMTSGNIVSGQTKYLELYCKDFQIHTFGFKFTNKEEGKAIVNAIVHHTFPTRADLLFAYDFGDCFQEQGGSEDAFPEYNCSKDWENEMSRQNCKGWRVTDVNINYNLSTSLSEYFVVPGQLLNSDLLQAAGQFPSGRILVWSFSLPNGISLSRISQVQQESEFKIFEVKMLSAIKQTCGNSIEPEVIDLTKCCPTVKEVQQSYEKLKELCMTVSIKEFVTNDLSWYSNLDNTQWLQSICKCLQTTDDVKKLMVNGKKDVVLKEEQSYDISCIICSLVQICLDPYYRTITGFQQLIQREWIALGHPFQKRHNLIAATEAEQSPVFLMFLDCVWQLMEQFPSCFAFTETYLTTLWDSVHLGIFKTFLFDNCHQQKKFLKEGRKLKQVNLPSVWKWNMQFSDDDLLLFNNPLYNIKNLKIAQGIKNGTSKETALVLRDKLYAKKLTELYRDDDKQLFYVNVEVLHPSYTSAVIKLWKQCYLRWNSPAEIIGGGNPSQYLQQCLLVEEIINLHHTMLKLQKKQSQKRPKSELIFQNDGLKSPTFLDSTYLTSSFPFTPNPTNQGQMNSFVYTPLSSYLQHSVIDYDYTDAVE